MAKENRLHVPIDGSDHSLRALAHVSKRVASHEPGETIAKVARQKHCGEIVLGSRRLGNLKGLIRGSVTTKVIHAARVPVTVVPRNPDESSKVLQHKMSSSRQLFLG